MVDRLEELLALLEAEEDEDEREDVLELAMKAAGPAVPAPASENETEEVPEGGKARRASAPNEGEAAPVEAEGLSWAADMRTLPLENQEEVPGADGTADEGVSEESDTENGAAEFWWDELAAPVIRQDGTIALRRPGAGDVELPELAGPPEQADTPAELGAVMESMTSAEKGLQGLYKQTVQASRPAAQNLPVEQAGRSLRADEPGRTAALTVDEMDRAVRRDSRRYDGGMTIY